MFQRILITGAAGFIGFHLARHLCAAGRAVMGYDVVNDYYDVTLKRARLKQLEEHRNFTFVQGDLADAGALDTAFKAFKPDAVVNLAAQAGVRYSLSHPRAYIHSNVDGFINILESCRHNAVRHLVYASSSSVYGANTALPFSVQNNVDHPVSLYAATKKANELMAHTYAHLYGLPCTGLRFFTVYGPWGRPDMAIYIFTKAMYEGKPIDVFNGGRMKRDFTYIDDIVESVARLIDVPATPDPAWNGGHPDPASSTAPYRLYNIGNHAPVELADMIRMLEAEVGIEAKKTMKPMQPGDVLETFADTARLRQAIGFMPSTPLETGLRHFVQWYRAYHNMGNGPESTRSTAG